MVDEQLFSQATPASRPQLTGLATRVKLAEERYANLARRNVLTEEALLGFEQDMKAELRALTQQTVELRRHVSEINGKVDAMVAELSNVARKHELAVVEHYLDLWQPMQFITREEAQRLIGRKENA